MRHLWALAAAAAAGLSSAATAAPSIEIRNAAARVVVIPEARQDVKVQVTVVNGSLPLTLRQDRERVILDGRLNHRIDGCSTMFGKPTVHVRGLGQVAYDNLPQVVVRTPLDTRVFAGGAVFGSIGRGADAVDLSNAGCGDWTVGNVKGELKINGAGSGDVRAGSAGQLTAHVAGSGDIFAKEVSGPVTLDLAGSGDATVDSVSGPLHAAIAGSGDVKVHDGHASDMVVRIAGSGDVRFGGVAESLSATIAGSGDIDVGRVTGPVKKMIFGSGDVNVGR
jgi:hypothetical protein